MEKKIDTSPVILPAVKCPSAYTLGAMRSDVRALTLLLCSLAILPAQAADTTDSIFSRSATNIWVTKRLEIPSPDGRKSINIHRLKGTSDGPPGVWLSVNGKDFGIDLGWWVDGEAAWAADSKAFFITYSDTGAVGQFHVKIVYVTNSGVQVLEPIPDGSVLLRPHCYDPEAPNVGAIKWMGSGSKSLLIAVEVPPHSSCANMGTFEVFEIELPSGKVVSRYDQLTAKKLFRSEMGGELLGADDSCIRKPQSCVPPGLENQSK